MTVAPSTAERFAIIPLSPGPAPADAIITGSMSAVMEWLPDTVARADAIEQAARAAEDAVEAERKQAEARACAVRMIADTVALVTSRMDALEARRAEQARRDAEREAEEEAKRIQAELDALPDPDNPDAHQPTGDIHQLPAKDEAEFALPEDPTGTVIPQPTAIEFDGD